MSTLTVEALLKLVEGDQEIIDILTSLGILPNDAIAYSPEDVESILVTRTLVRELDVNWPGVEVILRMRRQLLLTRLRLAEVHKEQ